MAIKDQFRDIFQAILMKVAIIKTIILNNNEFEKKKSMM